MITAMMTYVAMVLCWLNTDIEPEWLSIVMRGFVFVCIIIAQVSETRLREKIDRLEAEVKKYEQRKAD